MVRKQKLELTWINKEVRPRLEPRILLEEATLSYHAPHRVSADDIFDNRVICGDNLLALKALEQEFAGEVKCIYIDPPYNTGSAFEHYDDSVEHSLWLSLMRDRLEMLRKLLSEDGSIWIQLDDNEAHYCKVMCDEIFGRANFVGTVIWEKRYSPQNAVKWFSESHDFVLVYAKNKLNWYPNLLERSGEMNDRYRNPDNDPRGVWKPADSTAQGGHGTKSQFYVLTAPNGKQHTLPNGRCWLYTEPVLKQMIADDRIWFGADGNNVPAVKRFLSEVKQGIACQTIWKYVDVGHNQEAKKEVIKFNSTDIFATPKPERLMQRIIHLATNEGDLVLDSFAGSGTTGAVAHKMKRRWIMIENGEHCHTHIVPRLRKVIDGTDAGGVTAATGWQGGGGFRYFNLAPSLLEKDRWGRWVINEKYNPAMLSEALCKLEGFTYQPNDAVYWQHGYSTERDFIYVTTQSLSAAQLDGLNDEVGADRSLLVLCFSFRGNPERWPNLTVKKIPKQVLSRCEWGHDDYSLKMENLPQAPPKPGQQPLFDGNGDGGGR